MGATSLSKSSKKGKPRKRFLRPALQFDLVHVTKRRTVESVLLKSGRVCLKRKGNVCCLIQLSSVEWIPKGTSIVGEVVGAHFYVHLPPGTQGYQSERGSKPPKILEPLACVDMREGMVFHARIGLYILHVDYVQVPGRLVVPRVRRWMLWATILLGFLCLFYLLLPR